MGIILPRDGRISFEGRFRPTLRPFKAPANEGDSPGTSPRPGMEGESLVRFASALLFKDSKFLEVVRPRLEACLGRITGGAGNALADFGIIENERSFLLHGPANLQFEAGMLQVGVLINPIRVGAENIRKARIETPAARCLTVENTAMLQELAKLESGTLLASSGSEGGYPNSVVIAFLQALSAIRGHQRKGPARSSNSSRSGSFGFHGLPG